MRILSLLFPKVFPKSTLVTFREMQGVAFNRILFFTKTKAIVLSTRLTVELHFKYFYFYIFTNLVQLISYQTLLKIIKNNIKLSPNHSFFHCLSIVITFSKVGIA